MAQRWKLGDLRWGAGLVAIALAAAFALIPPSHRFLWELAALAEVAALVCPWIVRRVVPAALILLGFYGLLMIDSAVPFQLSGGGMYQSLWIGTHSVPTVQVVLVLSYGLLVLGGWLAWRTTDRTSNFGRVVFGRLAEPERPRQLWAFLLLPVVLMAGEMISTAWFRGGTLGFLLSVAVLAGTHWLVTRRPGLAVRLTVGSLIVLGLAAVALAVHEGRLFPAVASGTVMRGFPLRPVAALRLLRPELDGLVVLGGQADRHIAYPLAALQGLAVAGLGLALTPVAFPRVGRLVGLPGDGELVRQVQRLTQTRAAAVDTAAADLRRLERDLHDGAQVRLVALGMNLRAAERLIPVSPQAAAVLVAEARETSARALAELRELVRGVHPPVLADRGLGDALRALVLDTPLRMMAEIDLPDDLPASVESACYFAVAEILTNAAKHSGARAGQLSAVHAGGVLRITVTDFGAGGADPARGTGLAGIEKRLEAFDGIVAVSSPVGGPTMVVMEVPCVSSSARTSSC